MSSPWTSYHVLIRGRGLEYRGVKNIKSTRCTYPVYNPVSGVGQVILVSMVGTGVLVTKNSINKGLDFPSNRETLGC